MAAPLSTAYENEIKETANRHQDELLEALNDKGRGASLEELAKLFGWVMKNNQPNKALVYRTAQMLLGMKLIKKIAAATWN